MTIQIHMCYLLKMRNKKNLIFIYLETLRNELYVKYKIRSIKLLLNEVNTKLPKDEEGNLTKDINKISLVYKDYQNEDSWKAH